MNTNKINKGTLKNYLINSCLDRYEDYNRQAPKTWQEAKQMIKEIFEVEKPCNYYATSFDKYKYFNDWIFGLCFCSPIMEDLSEFTTEQDELKAEQLVADAIYNLIYIED